MLWQGRERYRGLLVQLVLGELGQDIVCQLEFLKVKETATLNPFHGGWNV